MGQVSSATATTSAKGLTVSLLIRALGEPVFRPARLDIAFRGWLPIWGPLGFLLGCGAQYLPQDTSTWGSSAVWIVELNPKTRWLLRVGGPGCTHWAFPPPQKHFHTGR